MVTAQSANGVSMSESILTTTAPALSALDRCDSCGAQAYVRVGMNNGELLFCAHHGRKYHEKLSSIASSWHDETDRLIESIKP